MHKQLKSLFLLDPKITYLNHGSFGACPKPIFNSLISWQKLLEKEPVKFLDQNLYQYLEDSRKSLSKYINCNKDDIVFCPNPSTALNTVIKSLKLNSSDEILTSDHEYGALDRTWNFICKKTGAKYIKQKISLPLNSKENFIDSFLSGVNKKTKVIFLSHITSSTGLIFPAQEICDFAKQKGILCIIDGAHVPGHIALDIKKLNPDIYTGACHKWMCAPKGTSFLYVAKELQSKIDPLIVSWGYESDEPSHSQFLDYHQWQGTRDMSAFLTMPTVINFLKDNNWNEISKICKKNTIIARDKINNFLNSEPICDNKFLGQMASIQIKHDNPKSIYEMLYKKYKIQIPLFIWKDTTFLRFSMQAYNSIDDIDRLIVALKIILKQ